MKKNIIVIGYDQGIANAGLCVMQYNYKTKKRTILLKQYITTPSWEDKCKRILTHYDLLNKCIKKYKIQGIACEKLIYNPKQKNGSRNKSASMMTVNEISAVVMLLAAQHKIIFREFMPMTVKARFAGTGKATKEDIIKEVMKRFHLRKTPIEHTADAIAIANTLLDEIIELT